MDIFRKKKRVLSHMNVLMICTGNICRSPMAEGLLTQLLPETLKNKVTVESAGTHALHGAMAQDLAIKTAADFDADITGHLARLVSINMLQNADMIIAMEKGQLKIIKKYISSGKRKAFLMGEFGTKKSRLEVSDPYGRSIEAYQECARHLIQCMDGVIKYIKIQLNDKK